MTRLKPRLVVKHIARRRQLIKLLQKGVLRVPPNVVPPSVVPSADLIVSPEKKFTLEDLIRDGINDAVLILFWAPLIGSVLIIIIICVLSVIVQAAQAIERRHERIQRQLYGMYKQ